MRKRSWGAISIDILEAALTPQKKTNIMYKANLDNDSFNKYFNYFLKNGFIVEASDSDGMPEYKISERGRLFLVALRNVQDFADVEQY